MFIRFVILRYFYLFLISLVSCFFSCYIERMTITQTIEIPADRRITLEIPREIQTGPVILTFTPASTAKQNAADQSSVKSGATPHTDALLDILSKIGGDIDTDEIRAERLAKHIK